ncbi:MAG TPA: hypothetical protein VF120_08690, partial [Ktedonobacterales bacterium]
MATTPRQILKGRLRQQGYATAGWATGTPHGRDGFARDFEVERKPHHVLYRASTLDNAANLPEEYIGDLGYSGALYDQEVLGLFTAFEGLVYTFQADTDGHVREARGALGSQLPEHGDTGLKSPPDAGISAGLSPSAACAGSSEPRSSSPCAGSSEPRADALSSSASAACAGIRRGVRWTPGMPRAATRWKEVIGGVDWGYTNPTAAVVFGLDGDGRAWQLDEWYQRRAPLDAVVLPALCDLTRRFGVERWWCGPDEPEHIAALQAALIREGLSCRVMAGNDAV